MRGKQRRRNKAARVAADHAASVAVTDREDPDSTTAPESDDSEASDLVIESDVSVPEDGALGESADTPTPLGESTGDADDGQSTLDEVDALDGVATDQDTTDQDTTGQATPVDVQVEGDDSGTEPVNDLATDLDSSPAESDLADQSTEEPHEHESASASTAQDLLNEAMDLDLDSDEAYIPLPPPSNRPGGLPVQPLVAITAPVPVVNPTDALFTPGPSEARPGAAFAKIELPGVNKDQDPLALLALGAPAPTLTAPAPAPVQVRTDAVAPPTARALPTDVPVVADAPTADTDLSRDFEAPAPALDVPVDLEPTGVPIVLPRVGDGAEAEDLGSGTLTPAPMPPTDGTPADPDGRRGRRWVLPLVAAVSLAVVGGGAAAFWMLDQDTAPAQEQVTAAPADLPAVGSGERLEHLQEGSRLLTTAVRGEITNRFQVPPTLDDPFVAQALGEPLDSYLTVNEWVPDTADYQFRLCLTHSSGGWLLYDSLYGGIVDLAANGSACPESD